MDNNTTREVVKRLDVNISAASTNFTATLKLDKRIKTITGVALTLSNEDGVSTLENGLTINGQEIFESNFGANMIFCYATVEGNKRYYTLNQTITNGEIKVVCNDTNSGDFAPYKAIFYFRCTQVD